MIASMCIGTGIMEATLRTVVTKQAEWAEYAVQGVGTADMRLRLEADSAKGSNEAQLRESQSVEVIFAYRL